MALIFFLFILLLSAQPPALVLRGVVLDPSGRAVSGARVELQPGGHVAYSDGTGAFAFAGLAAGLYHLTAAAAEFEDAGPAGVRWPGEAVELRFQKLRAAHMQLNVIGDAPEAALREIPGSAFLLDRRELEERTPADANEALRTVPGVHIREDSGPFAMRLNVGVRGLNPDRSRTLLVLEDGLPLALAPYGEPEMYYSPPIDRMSRVELLKGSGSILHGPQTIGGVLNFITPEPPSHPQGELELAGGQRGFLLGQASYAGTRDSTGWYVNVLRKQGDGWRDFYFNVNDFTAKLNFDVNDRNRLGFKMGAYDEGSNSTYLGLTEWQFRSNPNQNVVPDDFLKVRRYSGSFLHQAVLSPRVVLSSGLFAYTTLRNWRRQDFDRVRRPGVAYRSVAGDPAVPGDAIYLRDSSGNNNREFDVAGAQTRLSVEHSLFGLRHQLETGFRYLYEEHRDRRINGDRHNSSSGLIRDDETRDGDALSGFVQNRIYFSPRFSLTPGLRLEKYDYVRHIHRKPVQGVPADVDIRNRDGVFKAIPGAGAAWQPLPALTLFGGIHRGFAPPRVKDAITSDGIALELDAELSWNYEAGVRLQTGRGLRAEATLFTTDFENQIIPAAVSGGAVTTLINGGETIHRGAEFLAGADWSRLLGRNTGLFTEVRYTWLPVAQFTSGLYSGYRLPYAPETNLGLLAGYRHRTGFRVNVDGAWIGRQFADNRQTAAPSADGTVGLIPSYRVWNVSAGHQWRRERFLIEPFFTVKNFTNAVYISSRAPQGIQPGMFRQVNAGLKFRF